MVNRTFKTINSGTVLVPQTILATTTQDFATNTFSWTANKISASIVGYHRTYLALEVIQYRINTSIIAFYRQDHKCQ